MRNLRNTPRKRVSSSTAPSPPARSEHGQTTQHTVRPAPLLTACLSASVSLGLSLFLFPVMGQCVRVLSSVCLYPWLFSPWCFSLCVPVFCV